MLHQLNNASDSKQLKLKWVKPMLRRLSAGSADFEQTNGNDNFTQAS